MNAVALHNRIVAQQTKRSFLDLNLKTPGILRKAPKGYYFSVAMKLIKA